MNLAWQGKTQDLLDKLTRKTRHLKDRQKASEIFQLCQYIANNREGIENLTNLAAWLSCQEPACRTRSCKDTRGGRAQSFRDQRPPASNSLRSSGEKPRYGKAFAGISIGSGAGPVFCPLRKFADAAKPDIKDSSMVQ